MSRRSAIELWLEETQSHIYFEEDILADPLYYSNKLTQVLEEIKNFDREYIEGKTPDLEPKHIFSTFLEYNIHFLYENKYLNQLLASKSLVVRKSMIGYAFATEFKFNRENLSLSLLINRYLAIPTSSFTAHSFLYNLKYYLSLLVQSNLDKEIGDSHAKIIYQKFSIADIEELFNIVFLEELDKKQDYASMDVIKFLALNSLQNIDDTQKIESLKGNYLKLLSYIFKYNIPSTSKNGSATIGKCDVPLLFYINKYFGDSDTNRIGWKMFLQWTKSITPSSTPRNLINALGILNSFGPESTLVKNHIDVILECLQKIFFCTKHEALRDMNTQCLNNIIKVYPSSIPMEMANKYIEFIYTSPGFLNNPRDISEKGRLKSICFYFRDLFLTLNQYIPGCGIKYANDIANLNNQIPLPFAFQGSLYFIDEYFSGIDPQLLKNHPKYENFMEMFLSFKFNFFNSLITHSSQIQLIAALDFELSAISYIKIIKKLKSDPKFSISSIKPHIEKIIKGILDSSVSILSDNKQFILECFCMDEDLDFLLGIIKSLLANIGVKQYIANLVKVLIEINPSKIESFIKRNLFSPTIPLGTSILFAFHLHRFINLDDEIIRILNSVDDISIIPILESMALILSLSSDIIYQSYTELLKKTSNFRPEHIFYHVQLLNNPQLELYGHNRVELVKIFYKAFLQPSKYHPIQQLPMDSVLDLFQYIEPNDPFIHEFKPSIVKLIQTFNMSGVLELLVYIKSNKIKSLDCVIQEIVPSLKINEKTLESKDINSVSTLTQRTIIIDIIKYYFLAKNINMNEILNLCRVSKLFLSVCQNLFRTMDCKSFKGIDFKSFKPSSIPSLYRGPAIKIQTTPFSLAHKGIYHMDYHNFRNVNHDKINEIFYQVSSLCIKNVFLLYEPPTDLNELIHLDIKIPHVQIVAVATTDEITIFNRMPALESITLKYESTVIEDFPEIISKSLKHCPNLKEMNVKITIDTDQDQELDIFIKGIEMLKSHATNSNGSFKYNFCIYKYRQFANNPTFSKLLSYANTVTMGTLVLYHLQPISGPYPQIPTVFIPHLRIANGFDPSYDYCDFFKTISPKRITFVINSELSKRFHKYLKNLLITASGHTNSPTELTFYFKKSVPDFIDHVKLILKSCRKSQIINAFIIQHTDPTITNTLELCDFSKYNRYKLISPISGRFELQTDYENESDISDYSSDDGVYDLSDEDDGDGLFYIDSSDSDYF